MKLILLIILGLVFLKFLFSGSFWKFMIIILPLIIFLGGLL